MRATSRSRRRTRLRATALPTLRLTVNPTRTAGRLSSAGAGAAWSTKPGMAQRRPPWTRRKSRRFGRRPRRAVANLARPPKSSRKPLAARPATAGDDLAAADRCHPGPEAVPALAHQLARLIGAFHYATPSNTIPPRVATGAKSVGEGNKRGRAASQREARMGYASGPARLSLQRLRPHRPPRPGREGGGLRPGRSEPFRPGRPGSLSRPPSVRPGADPGSRRFRPLRNRRHHPLPRPQLRRPRPAAQRPPRLGPHGPDHRRGRFLRLLAAGAPGLLPPRVPARDR